MNDKVQKCKEKEIIVSKKGTQMYWWQVTSEIVSEYNMISFNINLKFHSNAICIQNYTKKQMIYINILKLG